MAKIILFDNETRDNLLPLTYTRPVCELRVGPLTIRQKWEKWMGYEIAYITQDYLAEQYPIDYDDENYIINGSVMPSPQLCRLLKQMEFNEALLEGEELIAAKLNEEQFEQLIHDEDIGELKGFDLEGTHYLKINYPWDIFRLNAEAIVEDFETLTKGRTSQPLSETNRTLGDHPIFIEEGANIEFAIINATEGPVYIGKDAVVMEGAMLRGPLAICEGSVVKMGARVYEGTTVGPFCKIGGEVKNSVLMGFSSKAHEGYLGDSVIGEWCNLGADTNTSNLKNTYEEVRLWNYRQEKFIPSGIQFCGLIMGDHSKVGINTMFNTGTVIGVCANIFGSGFPRNFIPSFAWGGHHGFTTFRTDKAFEMIERVMERKGKQFSVPDRLILLRVFEDSAEYRRWDKDN